VGRAWPDCAGWAGRSAASVTGRASSTPPGGGGVSGPSVAIARRRRRQIWFPGGGGGGGGIRPRRRVNQAAAAAARASGGASRDAAAPGAPCGGPAAVGYVAAVNITRYRDCSSAAGYAPAGYMNPARGDALNLSESGALRDAQAAGGGGAGA
jgi:hypothetical protein